MQSSRTACRQESLEREPVGGKSGHAERRGNRARTRHAVHRDLIRTCCAHQDVPRITDERRPGIAHESDTLPLQQSGEDPRCLLAFVVLVEGPGGSRNGVAIEQLPRTPRIFCEHRIDLAQHRASTPRQIVEVPNRGRHDVQHTMRPVHRQVPSLRNDRARTQCSAGDRGTAPHGARDRCRVTGRGACRSDV